MAWPLALSLLFSATAQARTKFASAGIDGNYVSALAAANRFLADWQAQDQEHGVGMLTNAAKEHLSPDRLDGFFSAGPDAAYEIGRGKKLVAGRYSFPVSLFEGHRRLPRAFRLIVVRSGNDDWAVDRLPGL